MVYLYQIKGLHIYLGGVKMNAKTAKLLERLENEKAKTEQLKKQVTASKEKNMFLEKQVSNIK